MPERFADVLTAAVADIVDHGYDSAERVDYWVGRLRAAAEREASPIEQVEERLRRALEADLRRQMTSGLARRHVGLPRYTIERLRPQLRAELDRRLLANRELIKLDRRNAMLRTEQRFAGWASSVPAGGTEVAEVRRIKSEIYKPLRQLPFHERRVAIDQGHKFSAALSDIVASDGGAIAAIWHSHWQENGYKYRPNHKKREGPAPDFKVYVIRGSWAQEAGFLTRGDGYTDEMTRPAEEPFCRCFYEYLYALRDLPDHLLTAKGRAELARVRQGVG